MKFDIFAVAILSFAIGYLVGKHSTKKKAVEDAQRIADEQIEDMRKAFDEKCKQIDSEIEEKSREKGIEYAMTKLDLQREDGTSIYDTTTETYELLAPDDFGCEDEYEESFLTLTRDGILVYDNGKMKVEDVEKTVGPKALRNIGLYEPSAIHVRNHLYHKDYEILTSELTYEELTGKREDENE